MRDKILELLRQNKGSLSGQLLSDKLHISRAAIGKHISILREQGYQIDASPHVGYHLVSAPDRLYPAEITNYLPSNNPWQLSWQAEVDSTNNVLRQAAQAGAPPFSALFAEKQTAGRGRLGRTWYSPDNFGIWFSVLLRPQLPPRQAQFFTLTTAVAITEVLRNLDYQATIKWPNDILLNGKKICGILAEIQADIDTLHWAIIGIGLNCYSQTLPPELQSIATSLELAIPRAKLAAQLLQSLGTYYERLCNEGFEPIRQKWLTYCNCLGKKITARTLQGDFCGIARNMNEQGYLLLELPDGTYKEIIAGDIIQQKS